ncbi:hypothetical protein CMV24_13705 [Pseudomonas plecoglossicida]|uniref:Uncharacterized protein n=1 Tax=Pseudomonas plecoglossicida TaxID=70775 RepID=A0A2A3M4L7_PSEDL|nr:hypothetical protein CMV24_13705 [Pseudomonas plecoglossicida]
MSRKGCIAAPAISTVAHQTWGRFAALSRHKAAPTGIAPALGIEQGRCFHMVRRTDPAALQYIRKSVYSKKHIH